MQTTQQPVMFRTSGTIGSNTLIYGPAKCTPSTDICCEVINDDEGTKTCSLYVEVSGDEDGPWYRTPYAGLENIEAGASRMDVFSVRGLQNWRLIGVTSEPTLSARVSVWLVGQP